MSQTGYQTDLKEDLPGPYNKVQLNESDLDEALIYFARTGIDQRRPRTAVGQVELRKEGHVVVCTITDTLHKVFEVLSTENILGLPVVDEKGCCVGMVDILDLIMYTVDDLFGKCDLKDVPSESEWNECFQQSQKFKETTVKQILDKKRSAGWSRGSLFNFNNTIPYGHSLLFAMECLAHPGCHRVTVTKDDGKISGIYTRSMAISDIRQTMHLLAPFAELPVDECMRKDVITMNINSNKAIDAFREMIKKRISAIALVDDNNKLCGCISLRDLRGVGASGDNFQRLFWSIKQFKEACVRDFPALAPPTHWTNSKTPSSARYVELSEATMGDVVKAMVDGLMNSIFVMDQGELVGVITQRELITCLLRSFGVCSCDD